MKEKCSEEMNWFRVILKCVRVNRVQENKFHHIYRFLPNGNLKNFNHYSRFVLITKHEGVEVKDFFLGYEFKRATSSICYESTLSFVTRYLNIIAYHRWHFTLLHTSSTCCITFFTNYKYEYNISIIVIIAIQTDCNSFSIFITISYGSLTDSSHIINFFSYASRVFGNNQQHRILSKLLESTCHSISLPVSF